MIIADIERLLNFSHTMNCKEIIFFTNKRMIGEMMYFLDFKKGHLKQNWHFYNFHCKRELLNFSERTRTMHPICN